MFGLLLLGVALWIGAAGAAARRSRWSLCGALLIVAAATLGAFEPLTRRARRAWRASAKGFGLVLAVLGVLQLVGAASGGRDPLQPLARLHVGAARRRRTPTPARTSTASPASPTSTSACSPPAAR